MILRTLNNLFVRLFTIVLSVFINYMLLRMIWVRLCVLYANTYILLSTQKGVLEVVLGVYNVGAKWVKWKCGYKYGVYAYILVGA